MRETVPAAEEIAHAPVSPSEYKRIKPYAENPNIVDVVLNGLSENYYLFSGLIPDLQGYYYCIALVSQSQHRRADCIAYLTDLTDYFVANLPENLDVLGRNMKVLKKDYKDLVALDQKIGGLLNQENNMKYINAKEVLPEDLFKQLQAYAAGTLLYVPKEGEEKSWGEISGYRTYLLKRNRMILNFFQYGVSLEEISNTFGLSLGTVKKIVYNKKHRENLSFRPEVSSAEEYTECGLLEEWVHTYLLFVRKNKEFSNGLYLEDRYFIGPVKMPLALFHRSSGPEEQMKWRVDATVFWNRVQNWTERMADGETTPPLIIGYAGGEFEINCDSPLFEALTRIGRETYPVIIWMTQRTDYEDFREKYGDFE